MSTLTRTRLRLAGDAANFDAPLDVLRRATPQFWRGNDVQFEIAVFFNGVLQDVSNLASLTLEVRPLGSGGAAPDPGFTPLMGATITSFDNTTTLDNWNAGTNQHALVAFTAAQSNIVAGPAWLSIFVITNDSPGRVITLCAGPVRVLEDGSGLATTPSPAGDTFYTAAESDARYAPIGGGGGGGGAAAWGSITGTLASQTDLNTALTSKAPLASPALTGTPTAPTVSPASDSSTKIATTAFVQAAIAAGGGGGSQWTTSASNIYYMTGDVSIGVNAPYQIGPSSGIGSTNAYNPSLNIANGAWIQSAGGESMMVNTHANSGGTGGDIFSNVLALWATQSGASCAIRFLRNTDQYEMGACGWQNNTGAFYLDNSMFLTASCGYPYGGQSSLPTNAPPKLILAQEGGYNGSFYGTARLLFDTDWSIKFNDPQGNLMASFPAPANFGGNIFNVGGSASYHSSNSPGANGGAYAGVGGTSSDGNVATLVAYNNAFNYGGYIAGGATVEANGNGLQLMASGSSGYLSFVTGSNASGHERARIDSAGNLLFSNAVTSAPSVTLASGQYQITVYDNGSAPVLRVRYNNGTAVKIGDLTLS